MYHPFLDQINIVIDPDLNSLCCNICLVGLAPTQVQSHLRKMHHGMKLKKAFFDKLVDFLNLPEDLPLPFTTDHGVMAFKGLRIHDGFACNHCPLGRSTKKNLRAHHIQSHADIPTPDDWVPCKMQQLNRGGTSRTLWRVLDPIPPLSPPSASQDPSAELVISNLRSQMSQNHSTPRHVPRDERVISPWLRLTRWHEHVVGYDHKRLIQLVQVPDTADMDPAFPGIKAAVETYFNEAVRLMRDADDIVLQTLNSPDPEAE